MVDPVNLHQQRLAALKAFALSQNEGDSSPDNLSDEDKTALLWARSARANFSELNALRNWTSHPVTAREIRRRVTGDPDMDWNLFLKNKYFVKPANRAISLGCGGGQWVVSMLNTNIAKSFVGLDISAGAIELARKFARDIGVSDRVTFDVTDLNKAKISKGFDLIVFEQSLHHVDKLERLLDQCNDALTEDGLILVNEYIGPNRFQWSDTTERLMNLLLAILPRELRLHPVSGIEKALIQRISEADVIAVDPSEAICSDRIMSSLEERFERVERKDFGGTLLQFALADIIANFDPDNPAHSALLRMMVAFEEELECAGVISSAFTFSIYKKKKKKK